MRGSSEARHQTNVAIIAPRDEPSSWRPHLPRPIATCSNSALEGSSRGAMTATLTVEKVDSSATGFGFDESMLCLPSLCYLLFQVLKKTIWATDRTPIIRRFGNRSFVLCHLVSASD